MLWISVPILLYRWARLGFHDLWGFHSSATVHGFVKSRLCRGFLRDDQFRGETAILVWFYALDYFGYFCFMNFVDFFILGVSIDLPRCMNL